METTATPPPRRRKVLVFAQLYVDRMRPKDRCPARQSMVRIGWSGLGAFLGILAIQALAILTSTQDALLLIGSFGASAVLVYGAPLADFSQPRNLVGGHLLSAVLGVGVGGVAAVLADPTVAFLAPATAVAGSIMLMHATRTLHPPGGATALIAVIGGERIQALGWWYALCPVAVGAVAMLLVALVVNNLSTNPKQHYPTYWV